MGSNSKTEDVRRFSPFNCRRSSNKKTMMRREEEAVVVFPGRIFAGDTLTPCKTTLIRDANERYPNRPLQKQNPSLLQRVIQKDTNWRRNRHQIEDPLLDREYRDQFFETQFLTD